MVGIIKGWRQKDGEEVKKEGPSEKPCREQQEIGIGGPNNMHNVVCER